MTHPYDTVVFPLNLFSLPAEINEKVLKNDLQWNYVSASEYPCKLPCLSLVQYCSFLGWRVTLKKIKNKKGSFSSCHHTQLTILPQKETQKLQYELEKGPWRNKCSSSLGKLNFLKHLTQALILEYHSKNHCVTFILLGKGY